MSTPLKRRWFRFSLRTMFVVVTVLGAWLGWTLKVRHDRAETRQWMEEQGLVLVGYEFMDGADEAAPWAQEVIGIGGHCHSACG